MCWKGLWVRCRFMARELAHGGRRCSPRTASAHTAAAATTAATAATTATTAATAATAATTTAAPAAAAPASPALAAHRVWVPRFAAQCGERPSRVVAAAIDVIVCWPGDFHSLFANLEQRKYTGASARHNSRSHHVS